jgi:membrane-associated phospholipid phosphatase
MPSWYGYPPGVTRLRVLTAVACGTLFAALTVAVAFHPGPFAVDRAALKVVDDLRVTWLTTVLTAVTTIGSSPWLVAIVVVVGAAAVAFRRDPLPGAWLLAEYLGAVILYQTLKAVLDRPRPAGGLVAATGSAYPSGHATQGIAFFGMLAAVLLAVLPQRIRVPAAVTVVIVGVVSGLSRVYLGVHWATDVAGGFLLGGAWLAVVLGIRTAASRRAPAREGQQRDGGPPPGEPPPSLRRSGG